MYQTKFKEPGLTISKDMIGAKLKTGHLTLTTPLSRVICPPYAGNWYSLSVYKIWSL